MAYCERSGRLFFFFCLLFILTIHPLSSSFFHPTIHFSFDCMRHGLVYHWLSNTRNVFFFFTLVLLILGYAMSLHSSESDTYLPLCTSFSPQDVKFGFDNGEVMSGEWERWDETRRDKTAPLSRQPFGLSQWVRRVLVRVSCVKACASNNTSIRQRLSGRVLAGNKVHINAAIFLISFSSDYAHLFCLRITKYQA